MPSLKEQIKLCGRLQWTLAGAALAGVAAFYACAYRPFSARLAKAEHATAAARVQIADNIEQTRDLARLAAEVERLKDQLQRSKQLPPAQDLPRLVRDLNQLGRQTGLVGLRYEPRPTVSTELFDELPVAVRFQGDFVGVFGFLRSAEQLPRLTRLRKLSLKSVDGKKGTVEAELTLNVYSKETP